MINKRDIFRVDDNIFKIGENEGIETAQFKIAGQNDNVIKIKDKEYSLDKIEEIVENFELLEKKILAIKQYITDKIISEDEAYISLKEIEENEKRYIEIRRQIIDKSEEEVAEFEAAMGIDKAAYKTFIRYLSEFILRDYFDYGLLYEIIQKPEVTNIKIYNGYILYTVHGSKDTLIYNDKQLSNKEVEKLVTKITRNSEMLTTSKPIVDTVLPKLDYRVNIILKNTTSSSTDIVAIRKKHDYISFKYYLETGFFPAGWEEFFKLIVEKKRNIIVAGGTGSGKTTLLNAVAKDIINEKESLITIEDTAEIYVGKPSFVGFYSKKDMTGVQELFKASLRQQPDRIFVGEIRDGQMAYYMIQAMNTGHDGNISTIHASSGAETIMRLTNLLKQSDEAGGYDEKTVSNMIRKSINYIIYVGKIREKNEIKYKMLEVVKISEEDPALKYRERLSDINRILSKQGMPQEEYSRCRGELEYIKLQMEYAHVEYEYMLKYDLEKEEYVINKIDELLKDREWL